MPTLTIRAQFPLGTFLGHKDVGHRADFPDTARLHAALLHAAGTGSTAIETPTGLAPSPASVQALEWLEAHPPRALSQPRSRPVSNSSAMSWRAEGVLGKKGPKKTLKRQSDAIAVAGAFGWSWDEDAPDSVIASIDALCADVACLGESDSPVVLDLVELEATHLLDPAETAFPEPGGTPVRTPLSGRLTELVTAHQQAHPRRRPSLAADKYKSDESPRTAPVPPGSVRELTYRPVSPPAPEAPWPTVVLLHVAGPAVDRIRVAVSTHRALISRLGEAPSLLTGQYATTTAQPANRLAIQFIEAAHLRHRGIETDVIALMIPAGADAAELAAIDRSLKGISRIYAGDGVELKILARTVHDTTGFWPEVPAEHMRFWRPMPSLVPETRRQRSAHGSHQWSLADAAMLSVGYVLRDRLSEPQRSSRRAIVDAVAGLGVRVHETRPLADSRPDRHAHKVPDGQIVFPYTALLGLTPVIGPQSLVAVGQSRHLGGGLLVPEDLLVPVARARGLVP